jgi:hypothetical protein
MLQYHKTKNGKGGTMTTKHYGESNGRAAFEADGNLYSGRKSTVEELRELARALNREQMRRAIVAAMAGGLVKLIA